MKHTPATPLPYRAFDNSLYSADAKAGHDSDDTAYRSLVARAIDADHADYLTHAANAYPRLVEALRRIRADATLDHHNNWCVDATIPEDGSLDSIESADALLRELGEAE